MKLISTLLLCASLFAFTACEDDEKEIPPTPTAINTSPVSNAGPDSSITLPINTLSMAGTASDLEGGPMTYQWSQISGPATVGFSNSTALVTDVTGLTVAGAYAIRLRVSDVAGAVTDDERIITVNPAPAPAPAPAPGSTVYNANDQIVVLLTGNSNQQGTGGGSDPAPYLQSYLGSRFSVVNAGIGGWDLSAMNANLTATVAGQPPVTSRKVAGKKNIVIAMEGTNSLPDGYATPQAYYDAVLAYCLRLRDEPGLQFDDVFYVGTLPRSRVAGTGGNANPKAKASNDLFKANLTRLRIHYIDLENTNIGRFSANITANDGHDSGFSSYSPDAPVGNTYGANRYYKEGTHLSAIGADVLARVDADHILRLVK